MCVVSPVEYEIDVEGAVVHIRQSTRDDGSFCIDDVDVADTRKQLVNLPWTWLHQPHGSDVVRVNSPGAAAGSSGDALLTTCTEAVLAVQTADCVPVAFVGSVGTGPVIAVAHVGWRGLLDGVIKNTVTALHEVGASTIDAVVGAHINAECYRFEALDRAPLADAFGPTLMAATSNGAPSLDMAAGIASALQECGVRILASVGTCTACGDGYFSHRARADAGRQVLAVWITR